MIGASEYDKNKNGSKILKIHIFTDSSGSTTENICNVTMSQFKNINYRIYYWPFLKNIPDIDVALEGVKLNPGLIIYTILPESLIIYLESQVKNLKNIKIVHALQNVIASFAEYTNTPFKNMIGRKDASDMEYKNIMQTINYAIEHDDGKRLEDVESADIIIIGPSRTSKTPTSFYLAYRGYRVINIPYVLNKDTPSLIYSVQRPVVVGFLIDPIRLLHLRQSRVLSNTSDFDNHYADIETIEKELADCRYLFGKLSCPTIDITDKSIEEVSSHIIKFYNFLSKH